MPTILAGPGSDVFMDYISPSQNLLLTCICHPDWYIGICEPVLMLDETFVAAISD